MKLIFICGSSISYVKYLFRILRFRTWNLKPVHFTCELGTSYTKTFSFHMWNENFICENVPIPYAIHMWNYMWNFGKGTQIFSGTNARGLCRSNNCLIYSPRQKLDQKANNNDVCSAVVPSFAARAIETMSVTFGVIFAKNGILTACRTQREIFRTISGSWWRKRYKCKSTNNA